MRRAGNLAPYFRQFPEAETPSASAKGSDQNYLTAGATGGTTSVILAFTLLSTPGPTVGLYALHVRETGGQWRNAIPTVLSENDGDISTLLGAYAPGTQLEIFFGAIAVTDAIARLATYVVQDGAPPQKLAPAAAGEFKSLARGERWEGTGGYVVPAVMA